MDAATAETLSRQNSSDAETTTPPATCNSCGNVCIDLKEVSELLPSSEEGKITCSETHLTSEIQSADLENRCTCSSSKNATTVDSEDIRTIVHEVLNSLVNQITEYEQSHVHQQKTKSDKGSEATPIVLRDSVMNSDLHSVSPTSEDSGIGCSLSHSEETKTVDLEHADHSADHRHDNLNESSVSQLSSSNVAGIESDESQAYYGNRSDPSLFASFSSSVKYWLGQGSSDKAGECCQYFSLVCYELSIIFY